ncbi:OLC1v1003364C1 [Oldenlandia corymbosa var. corymbosa]|uniref:OLC1v1003364C1 n=1 Tax=Oldenlandia corymbosa var. corymbosa TaxID=529605 RepID=A0AAV1DAJ2_OLDCO|nr:OLC1v1003364C1 [Oldenlandia corymbosa var. corymbosa]
MDMPMSHIFGGKDPFDDPFFTRPIGGLFGSSMFESNAPSGVSSPIGKLKRPIIEELDSDEEEMGSDGEKRDRDEQTANQNPLVEHPEDQVHADNDTVGSKSSSKELANIPKSSHRSKLGGEATRTEGVSFQRVSYGGINGNYYTASTTRRTGKDGVVLEERREADSTTGQATHRLSKGIHDRGHSVMRKLNSDGKVDTIQTLHNLEEDELANFERSWKGNADKLVPGWDNGFNFPSTTGAAGSRLTPWSGWDVPFRNHFGRNAGFRSGPDAPAHPNEGRPKKVVTIPIE